MVVTGRKQQKHVMEREKNKQNFTPKTLENVSGQDSFKKKKKGTVRKPQAKVECDYCLIKAAPRLIDFIFFTYQRDQTPANLFSVDSQGRSLRILGSEFTWKMLS